MSEEPTTVCEKAIEILDGTNDGDDLDPNHLWVVQEAVNGGLNERGLAEFERVYQQVKAGAYVKPWFHGIEHLTRDHQGYVRWKGKEVEHFSYAGNQRQEEFEAATELARRCRVIEARGLEPSTTNVVWLWKEE